MHFSLCNLCLFIPFYLLRSDHLCISIAFYLSDHIFPRLNLESTKNGFHCSVTGYSKSLCRLGLSCTAGQALSLFLIQRKTNKDVGFSHLCQTSKGKLAELMVNLIPSLCEQLEAINSHFQVRS